MFRGLPEKSSFLISKNQLEICIVFLCYFVQRQLKNNETRLEDKRPNRSDFTCRSTENSAYIPLHSRNPIKSGTLTHMIEKKEARIHSEIIFRLHILLNSIFKDC